MKLSTYINGLIDMVLVRYLGKMPAFYFARRFNEQEHTLCKQLSGDNNASINSERQSTYDNYGLREIEMHEHGLGVCLYNGELVLMPYSKQRELYLDYLTSHLSLSPSLKVLEAGCGNCINLVILKERHKGIQYYGIDISEARIKVAHEYYGHKMDGIETMAASITEHTPWPDNYFDVVFTVHCLEQIAHNCEAALKELYRIARKSVILIEPIYEFGNRAQRLYLINQDHNRVLLKTVKALGYDIKTLKVLGIASNPLNLSGLIEIEKAIPQGKSK